VTEPQLSVVLVTDRYETIRTVVRHLCAQTIADRTELVLVAADPDAALPRDADETAALHSRSLVRVDDVDVLARARAEGVRAARAPVVAFAESHCFPEPEWAERLLAAHEEPWAAVGPVIHNANPDSVLSWIGLLLDYGRWLGPSPGGDVRDLPGHNSSYKREVLLAYGGRLEAMLEAETLMHADLRARGRRLYQEPRARAAHLNLTEPAAWIGERFQTGRRFAAARRSGWPTWRRAAYAAGSPLIPAVRLQRILRDVRRTGVSAHLRGYGYALLGAALCVSAAGEAVGYVRGPGRSKEALARIELHKERYVRRGKGTQVAPG
jgi:hypothetical protein